MVDPARAVEMARKAALGLARRRRRRRRRR